MLSVRNLSASFHTRAGIVRAVRNVSFDVAPGETLGIVGESGSGKSVTCYSMMGLIPMPPGRIESGSAISMIFQDPMTSLNPYLTIGEQVAEPLVIHEGTGKKEARARALEQLALAGIPDAEQRMDAYPHQFSGGMRQRVMIAMALITLITHDLGVVRQYADRINVMYAGRIVESAPAKELLEHPRHAYTRALMKSIPGLHAKGTPLYTIPGLPPNMTQEPCGCSFRPGTPSETRRSASRTGNRSWWKYLRGTQSRTVRAVWLSFLSCLLADNAAYRKILLTELISAQFFQNAVKTAHMHSVHPHMVRLNGYGHHHPAGNILLLPPMDKGKVLVPEHPVGAGHLCEWNPRQAAEYGDIRPMARIRLGGSKFGRLHKGNGMFQKIRQPHPVFH